MLNIYVYDNNSKDKTNQLAREAGAIVRFTDFLRQGKTMLFVQCSVKSMRIITLWQMQTMHILRRSRSLFQLIRDRCYQVLTVSVISFQTVLTLKKINVVFHGFGNNLVRLLVGIIQGKLQRYYDRISWL